MRLLWRALSGGGDRVGLLDLVRVWGSQRKDPGRTGYGLIEYSVVDEVSDEDFNTSVT